LSQLFSYKQGASIINKKLLAKVKMFPFSQKNYAEKESGLLTKEFPKRAKANLANFT
jgi:hypothetical protein